MSANTSLLFSLIAIYCTNANRVLDITTQHSCETILIKITNEWLEAMDKGLFSFTGVVMINLRKDFNVADHKLLRNVGKRHLTQIWY